MELKFNVDVNTIIPESISFNYEELDEELTQALAKYTGTKVTEENMKECKDIRARINKLVKSFKDERTSLKKKILYPLDDFSNKIDLLVGKCNVVSGYIDEGIKRIENERKDLKRKELIEYMQTEVSRISNVIGSDIQSSNCWVEWFSTQNFLNATVSIDNAKLAILAKIDSVKDDVAVLRATYPVEDEYIKSTLVYAYGFNLASTIADMNNWREECKRIEQIKSTKVAEPSVPQTIPQNTIPQTVSQTVPQTKQFDDTKIYETAFKVFGTKLQLKNLADFFKFHGIKFEVTSKMVEVK